MYVSTFLFVLMYVCVVIDYRYVLTVNEEPTSKVPPSQVDFNYGNQRSAARTRRRHQLNRKGQLAPATDNKLGDFCVIFVGGRTWNPLFLLEVVRRNKKGYDVPFCGTRGAEAWVHRHLSSSPRSKTLVAYR